VTSNKKKKNAVSLHSLSAIHLPKKTKSAMKYKVRDDIAA